METIPFLQYTPIPWFSLSSRNQTLDAQLIEPRQVGWLPPHGWSLSLAKAKIWLWLLLKPHWRKLSNLNWLVGIMDKSFPSKFRKHMPSWSPTHGNSGFSVGGMENPGLFRRQMTRLRRFPTYRIRSISFRWILAANVWMKNWRAMHRAMILRSGGEGVEKKMQWLCGCFLKWSYPQNMHFNRVFRYKPSILGYPYFWKHPYRERMLWDADGLISKSWDSRLFAEKTIMRFSFLLWMYCFFDFSEYIHFMFYVCLHGYVSKIRCPQIQ